MRFSLLSIAAFAAFTASHPAIAETPPNENFREMLRQLIKDAPGKHEAAPPAPAPAPARAPAPAVRPPPPVADDDDLDKAPLPVDGMVPIDFKDLDVHYDIVVKDNRPTLVGRAKVVFFARNEGRPLFDFVPEPFRVRLNGKRVPLANWLIVTPRGGDTKMVALATKVEGGSLNELEISWGEPLDHTRDGKFRFSSPMVDVILSRNMLERVAPANLEFDRFPMHFTFDIVGADAEYRLIANGKTVEQRFNHWVVDMPPHFNATAPYFDLRPADSPVITEPLKPEQPEGSHNIPVTVAAPYGTAEEAKKALKLVREKLPELEAKFGPYPHPKLQVHLLGFFAGFEHAGAIEANESSLYHELVHMWIGRSFQPANGDAGWIDEAITKWVEDGARSRREPPAKAAKLTSRGPYFRLTPMESYFTGAELIAHLNYLLRDVKTDGEPGLTPILRRFVAHYDHKVITTKDFLEFLERESGQSFKPLFQKYAGYED